MIGYFEKHTTINWLLSFYVFQSSEQGLVCATLQVAGALLITFLQSVCVNRRVGEAIRCQSDREGGFRRGREHQGPGGHDEKNRPI